MIKLVKPTIDDLWFRQLMLADEDTMSYNRAWGGTIDFPKEAHEDWYEYWIADCGNERFYSYLLNDRTNEFVGEVAYHLDGQSKIYIADVIVLAKFRGNGYGRAGLRLLCETAKRNGIKAIYDNIAIDNPAIAMFLRDGFTEQYRTDEIIMLKKDL